MIQLPQAGIHRKTLPNWCQLLPSGWFFAHAAKSFWKPSTVTKPPELAEPPMKEPCRCTNLTSFVMICHWLMRSKCHEFRQMPKNGPNWPNRVFFLQWTMAAYLSFQRGLSPWKDRFRTCQTQQSLHCFKIRCGPCNQFGCWCHNNCWWQTNKWAKGCAQIMDNCITFWIMG